MPESLTQADRPTVEAMQSPWGELVLYEVERLNGAYIACERPVEVWE